jgi:hypothetical protein
MTKREIPEKAMGDWVERKMLKNPKVALKR